MPRSTANSTSRSMHTRNCFDKKQSPVNKMRNVKHGAYQKKNTAVALRKRRSSDASSAPLLFHQKIKEDFIVTDQVLKSEDITVALAYVVSIYSHLMAQFAQLSWRIASAFTAPAAAHSLEMNSILTHLLSKHFRPQAEKIKIEDVKEEKVSKEKSKVKDLLSLKLEMYEI